MGDESGPEDGLPFASTRPSSRPVSSGVPVDPGEGDVLGDRWRLEHRIARGGMGSVWRATDLRLQVSVAVKVLSPEMAGRSDGGARFLREARAAAQLQGPHVVSVLDCSTTPGEHPPFMAMELLRGEDLRQRLKRGPLGYLETRSVVRDVCTVLAKAHPMGIVHRDLKPANIFMVHSDEGCTCKVLDFGIAKVTATKDPLGADLTETGARIGTLRYMSPEQCQDSKNADHRADLWALAVIAYECLTGRPAFPSGISFPAPRPSEFASVPAGFDAWFARAVDQDIQARCQTASEFLRTFLELDAEEAPGLATPAPERPRDRVWASDANQIDIQTIDQVTFKNALVRGFVEEDRRCFISGAKGCGKTLLLTCKRALISKRYLSDDNQDRAGAVTLIPEGRPYLDLMSDLSTVAQSTADFMGELGHAKRLWSTALRLSVVSHHPTVSLSPGARQALPPRLRAWAEHDKVEPTVVAKELLSFGITRLHRLLDLLELHLEHAIRSAHSGTFIFIDKIDQALRGVSRKAWVAMQAGLIEAAWDLMNTNAHVKVYATIREEAFSSYESDIKANLFGATTNIRYTKTDLYEMLNRLTGFYEGLPLKDFVNVDVVTSPRSRQSEGSFDFLHRHTLGRPRDLVIVASEISRDRMGLDERKFKRIVYETSAQNVTSNVFDEMRAFLEVLKDRPQRGRFFSLLPYSVLTHDDLVDVWCRFHGVERSYYETYGKDSDEVYHPFRELYDCGLLGLVRDDPVTEMRVQQFRQPHQPMDLLRLDPPTSSFYLLHPTVHALLRQMGLGDEFRAFREVRIGHGLPWLPHYPLLIQLQRELLRNGPETHPEIQNAVLDVMEELARHVRSGRTLTEARNDVVSTPLLRKLYAELDRLGWDELHLALLDAFPGQTTARER